jgi:hypothetical protein
MCLGFRVHGLELTRFLGAGCSIYYLRFRVEDLRLRVKGLESRVKGIWLRE